MLEKHVILSNINCTYEHPFSEVVRVACQFQSRIYISDGDKQVNAKSIMGVMAFGLTDHMSLTITAEGCDEDAALDAMETLLTK